MILFSGLVNLPPISETVSWLHFEGSFAVGVAGRALGHWEVMQGAQAVRSVRSGLVMLQVVVHVPKWMLDREELLTKGRAQGRYC